MALVDDRWRWGGWTMLAGAVLIASVRVVTAQPPPALKEPDETVRRSLFEAMAKAEPGARRSAKQRFAGDAWSQDDEFHAQEMARATSLARQHAISVGSVLRALDDGMREGWPRPPGVIMQATVPPCRPRPVY